MSKVTNQYQILKEYVIGNKDWSYSQLNKVNLYNTVLKAINLTGSRLTEVNFDSCNLENARFNEVTLESCDFRNTRLKRASFIKSDLSETNFYNSHLEATDFRNANLENADFTEAYLYCADLRGTCLKGVKLSGTFFARAVYDDDTVFDDEFIPEKFEMIYQPCGRKQKINSQDYIKQTISNRKNRQSNSSSFAYRGVKYQLSNSQLTKQEMLQNLEVHSSAIKYRGANLNLQAQHQPKVSEDQGPVSKEEKLWSYYETRSGVQP